LRGLSARNRVYDGVRGEEAFAPWLEQLEKRVSERTLGSSLEQIPSAW